MPQEGGEKEGYDGEREERRGWSCPRVGETEGEEGEGNLNSVYINGTLVMGFLGLFGSRYFQRRRMSPKIYLPRLLL